MNRASSNRPLGKMAIVAGLFLVAAGAVALWLWSRPAPALRGVKWRLTR